MIFFGKPVPTFPDHALAADDHGAQAFGHQHRQSDMNHQEGDDRRHANEVDITRDVIAAEQGRQPL